MCIRDRLRSVAFSKWGGVRFFSRKICSETTFFNNLKKVLVVFWQHRNEKKPELWNAVAAMWARWQRFFRRRHKTFGVNNWETVRSRLRKAAILFFGGEETDSTIEYPSQLSITRSGRWSGYMSAETLRLPERLLIWGELLYFEGWVSCRIWCKRWRRQLLDFSSLLRIHLWIGSSTERRMRAESLSVT